MNIELRNNEPDPDTCDHDWVKWSGKRRCRLCGATHPIQKG